MRSLVRAALLLLTLGSSSTIGTHITLKSRPGALFSIPLEFGTGRLSPGAPDWVKYEGGTLKGVAGEPGLYKFQLTEDDGTEVTVDIGVGPKDSAEESPCSIQKSFSRVLSLEEKLDLGIPGGVYVDGLEGSVLHYPTPCKTVRRRHARQTHDHHGHGSRHRDDDDHDELIGSGDDRETEEYDDEDEEDAEDIGEHIVPILPTPTFDLDLPVSTSAVLAEYGQPTPILSSISISPTPTLNTPLESLSVDLYIPHEIGSGNFEILPSSPVLVLPSSTPTLELPPTPTPGPEAPVQKKTIERLALPAGKVFKFEVGPGYFTAPNPIAYSLSAAEESLPDWVVIENMTLVAWPPGSEVSDYKVVLVAQDTVTLGQASADLVLSVRQSPKTRNYNHEFEIGFQKSPGSQNVHLYEIMGKVQEYAGGRGKNDFVSTKIEKVAGIYKLKWINESLLVGENLKTCPTEELTRIYTRLATPSGLPQPGLTEFLGPTFSPISVGIHLNGNSVCGGVKTTNITGQVGQGPPNENFQPQITRQIDSIKAVTGELLIYKVPDDFCHDEEDGDTRYLNLDLLDRNYAEVGNDSWLQFDKKNQEFFGLPPAVVGPNIEEWTLKCSDTAGKSANDALELKISPHLKTDYAAEFTLFFKSQKGFNAPEIRKFIQTLAEAFNDSIANIIVKTYQHSAPNVQFVWFNRTNPSTEYELTNLRRMMFSDEGPPRNDFKALFVPDGFNLSNGQVIPKGRLTGQGTFTHEGDVGENNGVTEADVTYVGGVSEEGAYLITYIIPSVLIAVMVLLAALIACLLTRKRKAIPSGNEENRAFIKKRTPVIFKEEMEEDKGARSRSPAILREEHPPLPPEYRRSPIEQYQPPPPMSKATGTRGMRPGTNYRRPPPYVPP